MTPALFASLLWGLGGAMFYAGTVFGLIPLVLSVPIAIGYVRGVYPFWVVNAEPALKPYIYQFHALCFIVLGVVLILVRVTLADLILHLFPNVSHDVYTAGRAVTVLASIPVFLFGGYNYYVSMRIHEVKRRRTFSRKEIDLEIAKLTTGRLGGEEDLNRDGNFGHEGFFVGAFSDRPAFLNDAVHLITFGGPGSGKTVGAVIPNILHWPHSLFITDPKGELAEATAEHRKSMGQEVVFLNPWTLRSMPNTPYNPLSILLKDIRHTKNPSAAPRLRQQEVSDARTIALVLIPEPPKSDENKWVRDGARELLQAYMLYFASAKPQLCSLIGLQNALSYSDEEYTAALVAMRESREFGGVMANYGNRLCNSYQNEPVQHGNCRTEASQALQTYVCYGPMRDSVSIRARFDMESFVKKPTTVYLMLSGEHRDANQSWMRLLVTNAVEAVGRHGTGEKPSLFMLDEFANLGRLPNVIKGLAEYRGSGFHAWLVVQDREQLATVYPNDEAKALENLCDVTQVLDCKLNHATDLSTQIGQKGVERHSTMKPGTFDAGHKDENRTLQIEQLPVMTPQEILQLGSKLLVFQRSRAPLLLDKCPFWEVDPWRDQVRPSPSAGTPPQKATRARIRISPRRR